MSAEKFTSRPVPSQASPALREYLEDQISRLQLLANGAALREEEETITGDWTFSGSLTIPQASVTDHQAALALAASQITSGTFANARIAQGNVTQHQAALALAASQITSGTFANARIAQGNVTQHQAALTIAETQITDGSLLARVAANETISGSWTFSNQITINDGVNTLTFDPSGNGNIQGSNSAFDIDGAGGLVRFGRTIDVTAGTGLNRIFLMRGNNSTGSGIILEVTAADISSRIYMHEGAAAGGNLGGKGQLWVKNTNPQQLWFTSDSGVSTQIV